MSACAARNFPAGLPRAITRLSGFAIDSASSLSIAQCSWSGSFATFPSDDIRNPANSLGVAAGFLGVVVGVVLGDRFDGLGSRSNGRSESWMISNSGTYFPRFGFTSGAVTSSRIVTLDEIFSLSLGRFFFDRCSSTSAR